MISREIIGSVDSEYPFVILLMFLVDLCQSVVMLAAYDISCSTLFLRFVKPSLKCKILVSFYQSI